MSYTTNLGNLVDRTRRWIRDYGDYDSLTGAVSDTSSTTINVADNTIYAKRWPIEIDYETMQIRSVNANGTQLTVERGAFGSTAATHTNGTKILVRPAFYAAEIIDQLNQALVSDLWPYCYLPVVDTSITTTDQTYEYTVPNMPGTYTGQTLQIPYVYEVQIKYQSDLTYRNVARWQIVKAANGSRLLKFRSPEPGGASVRVLGAGPFPALVNTTDTLNASFPPQAEFLLPMFASAYLMMSGEAGRSRYDTGAIDAREQATRPGTSMSAGLQLLARAREDLLKAALPPLPKHSKRTI